MRTWIKCFSIAAGVYHDRRELMAFCQREKLKFHSLKHSQVPLLFRSSAQAIGQHHAMQ